MTTLLLLAALPSPHPTPSLHLTPTPVPTLSPAHPTSRAIRVRRSPR